jgi:hypothetical protein
LAFYEGSLSYAVVKGVKLPSFEEFFGLASKETGQAFDEKTDKALEEMAIKKLMEKRAKKCLIY